MIQLLIWWCINYSVYLGLGRGSSLQLHSIVYLIIDFLFRTSVPPQPVADGIWIFFFWNSNQQHDLNGSHSKTVPSTPCVETVERPSEEGYQLLLKLKNNEETHANNLSLASQNRFYIICCDQYTYRRFGRSLFLISCFASLVKLSIGIGPMTNVVEFKVRILNLTVGSRKV